MKATASTIYELLKAQVTIEALNENPNFAREMIHRELDRFRNSVLREAAETARIYDAPIVAQKIELLERLI